MSGTGVSEAENNNVLSPEMIEVGLVLVQPKFNCTSTGGTGALGLNANT